MVTVGTAVASRPRTDPRIRVCYHGTPMSAQQFMEMLFGKLPEFFKDEAELRALWSDPGTRKKLLEGLAEKGFGHNQLVEMRQLSSLL